MKRLFTIVILMAQLTSTCGQNLFLPAFSEGAPNNYFTVGTGDGGSLTTYNTFLRLHYGLAIGSPYANDGRGGYEEKATISIDARNGNIYSLGSINILNAQVNGNITLGQSNFLYQNNSSGVSTRIFGIHPSNYMYIGGIDAQIAGIVFRTNGSQERMVIDGISGNIGIGTTNPQEALSVNGNIRSK
jgi:hypothetical protein